ncbi:hypothetical protein DIPPA_19964 [Diplonema papillatum]|nr:hypothetical protein DIPPA_19964 [Diplonema papillatum]
MIANELSPRNTAPEQRVFQKNPRLAASCAFPKRLGAAENKKEAHRNLSPTEAFIDPNRSITTVPLPISSMGVPERSLRREASGVSAAKLTPSTRRCTRPTRTPKPARARAAAAGPTTRTAAGPRASLPSAVTLPGMLLRVIRRTFCDSQQSRWNPPPAAKKRDRNTA